MPPRCQRKHERKQHDYYQPFSIHTCAFTISMPEKKKKDNYYVPFGIFFAFFSERFEFIGVCSSESALEN
jgi:hypothetical protein